MISKSYSLYHYVQDYFEAGIEVGVFPTEDEKRFAVYLVDPEEPSNTHSFLSCFDESVEEAACPTDPSEREAASRKLNTMLHCQEAFFYTVNYHVISQKDIDLWPDKYNEEDLGRSTLLINKTHPNFLLFVDTETTGLPEDESASFKAIDNWPSIRQIAWILYTKDGEMVDAKNYVTTSNTKTTSIDDKDYLPPNELPIHDILPIFLNDLSQCDVIVGHNIEFDVKVILCELYRLGLDTNCLEFMEQFCTMKNSIEVCGFDTQRGDKYPKLQELYRKLFHKPFENAHDAYCDIKATTECYWELYNNRLFEIEDFPVLLSISTKNSLANEYARKADECELIQGRYDEAITFYKKAASLGHINSMARLGHIYYIRREMNKAVIWYKDAIENGLENIDCYLECAEACSRDELYKEEGQSLYSKWVEMCEANIESISDNHLCQYVLAFLDGTHGQVKNADKAIEICNNALSHNRTIIRQYLIYLLDKLDRRSELVNQFAYYLEERQESKPGDWIGNLGSIAEKVVTYLFEGQGVSVDYFLAKRFIDDLFLIAQSSANKKEPSALLYYYLGQYYEKGLADCLKDDSKAFNCYLRASSSIPEAEREIGIMYLYGTGCKKSKRMARAYLKRAKRNGIEVSHYLKEARSLF